MQPDDPNHRPTVPLQPPAESPDLTRTFATDPSSTSPFVPAFAPIPVGAWPAGLTRYQPLHRIGDGGMGEVYLAHDTQLDRQVAIKFARLGRHPAHDTAERILAEARAAARLHHPGICPVYDADVCDGVPYLTMAFVQGPNLAAELKRLGPCPPKYAAKLVRDVAEAMQYAHEHGVIHRDLKPANILLTAEHTPVVTDFGLAVRLDREGLAHGVVSGTPHYMAPEQAAGDAAKIGERTDVFALGVILFEMLTGRVPFDGTAREVLEQVKTTPVPPVRKLRKDVPERLARIVAKATARHPADRFGGMSAFADVLTDYLSTEERPKKRRFRWLFWLFAGPALLSLTFVALSCCVGLLLPAIQKVREAANRIHNQKERDERVAALTEEGRNYAATGDLVRAAECFDEAVKVDPEALAPRHERAKVRERMGLHREAAEDLDVLIDQAPNSPDYRRDRAAVRLSMNRPREAVEDLNFAIRLQTDSPEAYALRGEAYHGLQEYAKALADLNRAIEFDQKNARAFRLRAVTKAQLGDLSGSESDGLRATELERERPPEPPPPHPPLPPPVPGK